MALLDKPVAPHLYPIVERLATECVSNPIILVLLTGPLSPSLLVRLSVSSEADIVRFPAVLCYPLLVSSDQFRFARPTDAGAVFVARIKVSICDSRSISIFAD